MKNCSTCAWGDSRSGSFLDLIQCGYHLGCTQPTDVCIHHQFKPAILLDSPIAPKT